MTALLDCKGVLWVLESISLSPKCVVCKRQRMRVLIPFYFLMIPGGNLMSLFLKERLGILDLWSLLRLSVSKVGKCQVYFIFEKRVCG